jgi:hypothetical protein
LFRPSYPLTHAGQAVSGSAFFHGLVAPQVTRRLIAEFARASRPGRTPAGSTR